MKKATITAFNGIGKNKTLAGSREVDKPDNVAEAVKMFGEEDTFDYIWSSYTIEVQRQIRAGTTETTKALLAKEKAKVAQLEAYAKEHPEFQEVLKGMGWEFSSTGEATPPEPIVPGSEVH